MTKSRLSTTVVTVNEQKVSKSSDHTKDPVSFKLRGEETRGEALRSCLVISNKAKRRCEVERSFERGCREEDFEEESA